MDMLSVISESAQAMVARLAQWLPGLLLAILILVGGWLCARLLRYLLVKGLRAVNFGVLAERSGLDSILRRGGVKYDSVSLLGALAYWLIVLLAAMAAFNSVGLPGVSELLGQIALFVPSLLVAVVALAFGVYFARFAGDALSVYLRNIGFDGAERLGGLLRVAVVVFVVALALDQLGIGGALVGRMVLILLAGVGLGLAIAFGLGGRDWAAGWLERWRARRTENRPK
jgi:hypothetical protein